VKVESECQRFLPDVDVLCADLIEFPAHAAAKSNSQLIGRLLVLDGKL